MNSGFEGSIFNDSPIESEISGSASKNCSISLAGDNALLACKNTCSALKELRESLIKCHDCPMLERCELPEHLNLLVDQAVSALSEEWGW